MKFVQVGAIAALTLASLLSACGGKAQYTVQGTISGLTLDGLQITNAGETLTAKAGDSTFAFSKQIDYGSTYDISVGWPTGSDNGKILACGISGATGNAGYTIAISSAITCQPVLYAVGGHFSGFTEPASLTPSTTTPPGDPTRVEDTLTLINGSDGNQITISSSATGSGDYALPSGFAVGAAYAVTIFKQPAKSTCTLSNASGRVDKAAITNIFVTCTKN